MDIVINHVRVLTGEAEHPMLEEAFVGIREGCFGFVSLVQPRIMAHRFVDGAGKTLVSMGKTVGEGEIREEAPADALLLDGLYTPETVGDARVSDICMIIRSGIVCGEVSAEA